MEKTYKGSCFCGAVSIAVTGEPVAMGYCHCASCRHWSAGPVNAYTLWRPGAVKITAGAENIGTYNKTPASARKWCKTLRGPPIDRASGDHGWWTSTRRSCPGSSSGHASTCTIRKPCCGSSTRWRSTRTCRRPRAARACCYRRKRVSARAATTTAAGHPDSIAASSTDARLQRKRSARPSPSKSATSMSKPLPSADAGSTRAWRRQREARAAVVEQHAVVAGRAAEHRVRRDDVDVGVASRRSSDLDREVAGVAAGGSQPGGAGANTPVPSLSSNASRAGSSSTNCTLATTRSRSPSPSKSAARTSRDSSFSTRQMRRRHVDEHAAVVAVELVLAFVGDRDVEIAVAVGVEGLEVLRARFARPLAANASPSRRGNDRCRR